MTKDEKQEFLNSIDKNVTTAIDDSFNKGIKIAMETVVALHHKVIDDKFEFMSAEEALRVLIIDIAHKQRK